jgi:phosphotransferase system HPr-like phosphotransfer protein
MTETSLEELVEERQFAGILQTHGEPFFRLSNTLLGLDPDSWNKRHYFQLINESNTLESFLDDYGARFNRTYSFFTEIVASLRWFAMSGYSLSHASGRLASYGLAGWFDDSSSIEVKLGNALSFCSRTAAQLLRALREEARLLGIELTPETFPESNFLPVVARRRLPRNVGQDDPIDDEQKIAEVASKFLTACGMLDELGVRPISDPLERRAFLKRACTEEQARVYEATIHNLQSTYDTHLQNTVAEAEDQRLARLRGHVSGSLHILASVTYLTHFFERHEDDVRSEEVKHRIGGLVSRAEVQSVILDLLVLANHILRDGRGVAEDLLPEYTNLQQLEIELAEGLTMHARPAALIVGVVSHYGTPVEMEVAGQVCNAGSILELLVCVGSHPDQRRFVFRGDENPLRDIRLLFESQLGENGLDALPSALSYLNGG